ncbi:MAG: hypothetical protein INH41_08280 [Myxococcaceae bacterium]|nr:hypothetical protein [Myxococcaceae bacterium]
MAGSQGLQLAPAAPQAEALGVTQVLPLQHPFAHVVSSHTHRPPAQRWPWPHGGPEPQRHCPPLQVSLVPVQARHTSPPWPHA